MSLLSHHYYYYFLFASGFAISLSKGRQNGINICRERKKFFFSPVGVAWRYISNAVECFKRGLKSKSREGGLSGPCEESPDMPLDSASRLQLGATPSRLSTTFIPLPLTLLLLPVFFFFHPLSWSSLALRPTIRMSSGTSSSGNCSVSHDLSTALLSFCGARNYLILCTLLYWNPFSHL